MAFTSENGMKKSVQGCNLTSSNVGLSTRPLRVAAYNCQGAMRSALYISTLLTSYNLDFICICEHWLFPDSLCFLESLSTDYYSYAVADSSLNGLDICRRGKGGVAIMWKKQLNYHVSSLPIDSDRIIGVSVELDKNRLLTLLAVYLPSTNATVEQYTDCLDLLSNLYHMYCEGSEVIILGDMNAQLNGPRYNVSKYNKLSQEFLQRAFTNKFFVGLQ